MSSDGRFVAFESWATNLVPGTSTSEGRIYVTDLCAGATSHCSSTTYLALGDVDSDDFVQQDASISANGRYVVFSGWPIATGDRLHGQIYLRDTCRGKATPEVCTPSTMTVSVGEDGSDADRVSDGPSVSGDGRFVVFQSSAQNLVSESSNPGSERVFLRDTCLGLSEPKGCVPATSVVSLEPALAEGADQSFAAKISPSGRYIGFGAISSTLSDSNQHGFVRDTCFGAENSGCMPHTTLISVTTRGELGNGRTFYPWIGVSADGSIVSFGSDATNLAAPTSGLGNVFLMLMPSTKR